MTTRIHEILRKYPSELLTEWLAAMATSGVRRDALMKEAELREQCAEFLRLLTHATEHGNVTDVTTSGYTAVREMLERLSRARSPAGLLSIGDGHLHLQLQAAPVRAAAPRARP